MSETPLFKLNIDENWHTLFKIQIGTDGSPFLSSKRDPSSLALYLVRAETEEKAFELVVEHWAKQRDEQITHGIQLLNGHQYVVQRKCKMRFARWQSYGRVDANEHRTNIVMEFELVDGNGRHGTSIHYRFTPAQYFDLIVGEEIEFDVDISNPLGMLREPRREQFVVDVSYLWIDEDSDIDFDEVLKDERARRKIFDKVFQLGWNAFTMTHREIHPKDKTISCVLLEAF